MNLTQLDKAMLRHMHDINILESRPFSYLDFRDFEVLGKRYSIAHGTFRNKISMWIRQRIVRLVYNSKLAFYSLTSITFPYDTMTRNHMGISAVIPVTGVIPYTAISEANSFFDYLKKKLDTNTNSIHDIHNKFTVLDIYKIISSSPKYSKLINPFSKDIPLEVENIDGMHIHIAIHRTDTVTVIVGCSREPITIDERGITRLSCALTRIEERLARKLDECGALLEGGYERLPVPNNERWQDILVRTNSPMNILRKIMR